MPLLNEHGECVSTTTVSDGAGSAGGTALVPLEQWNPDSGDGVIVDVDVEPSRDFQRAPVVAVDFPSFSDGRGLSLAVLLRTRFGFTGELRAVGDVHPDLVHYLKRCGFDTFQMSEDRPWPGADSAVPLAPYSDYYQASATVPEPAFRRIQRGI